MNSARNAAPAARIVPPIPPVVGACGGRTAGGAVLLSVVDDEPSAASGDGEAPGAPAEVEAAPGPDEGPVAPDAPPVGAGVEAVVVPGLGAEWLGPPGEPQAGRPVTPDWGGPRSFSFALALPLFP